MGLGEKKKKKVGLSGQEFLTFLSIHFHVQNQTILMLMYKHHLGK